MKVKKVVIEPLDEFFSEVKSAVAKHESGADVNLDYISFNSIEELNKILTPKRKQLLDAVKKFKPRSLHQLARILGRDYKNVYKDAVLLEKTGFLDLKKERNTLIPEVPYDEIDIKIKVGTELHL